jgi:hypothetical protein
LKIRIHTFSRNLAICGSSVWKNIVRGEVGGSHRREERRGEERVLRAAAVGRAAALRGDGLGYSNHTFGL